MEEKEMAIEMANETKAARVVDLIVTHIRPHFDEVLAIYLLKCYGEKFFPGIGDAEVETWGEGKMLKEYASKTADNLLQEEKILCIGTCGGMFDEHGNGQQTCAHLVADYLGVAERPELKKILAFCQRVDHDAHSMPMDPHQLMKDMYEWKQAMGEDQQSTYNWAMDAIQAFVYGQRRFHACPDEFTEWGKIYDEKSGWPINLAVVHSDNYKMNKWVRHAHKSPEIVVQIKKSGHVLIFTDAKKVKKAVDMRDLARIVRIFELREGRQSVPNDWKRLEAPGTIPECLQWHFYSNGLQLFNSTQTSPDVEPTKLTIHKIKQAIVLASSPLHDPCTAVKCYKSCQKYDLGLITCRQKRFAEKKGGK
jgi:hypothetical protein